MRVGARNLDRHAALCRPDVDEGSIARPWKLRRQRTRRNQAARRHAFEKNLLRPLVGVELRIILGAERALRLAGYQGAAEPVPILVMTLVEMSQQPANIGGLTANEVAIAFGRVGVAALAVPVEQPQATSASKKSRAPRG